MERDLNDIEAFIRVVQQGSFTSAAKHYEVPVSTISRRVQRLEERLETRLLHRTTRKVHLTDAGRVYFEQCVGAVELLEGADDAMAMMRSHPVGVVRLTAPASGSERMWSLIQGFLEKFPDVDVDCLFSEHRVDMVREGIDVAIRGGNVSDTPTFVARELRCDKRILVASPTYLQVHGMPQNVDELRQHQCVLFKPWTENGCWRLKENGQESLVRVRGRVRTDNMAVNYRAITEGFGIGQFFERQQLVDDRLVEVLPTSADTEDRLFVLYPSRRHLVPAVRALVDYLLEVFKREEDDLKFE